MTRSGLVRVLVPAALLSATAIGLGVTAVWRRANEIVRASRNQRGWFAYLAAVLCPLALLGLVALPQLSLSGLQNGLFGATQTDRTTPPPSASLTGDLATRHIGAELLMVDGALIGALGLGDAGAVERAKSALLAAAHQAERALGSASAVPAGGARALPGHPDSRLRTSLSYTRAAIAYARAGALADDIHLLQRAQTLLRMALE